MTVVEKSASLKSPHSARARKQSADETSVAYYGPLSLAIFVVAWEVLVRWSGVPELYLPAPSLILAKLYSLFVDGGIAYDLGLTLMRILAGFGIAAVVGIFVGVLMGTSRKLYAIGDAFVSVIYPIPKISLLPLLVIWLGSGNLFQIILAALGCFFPIVVNTVLGVRQCDPGLILAARDLGATENQIKWKVIVPAAIPSIFGGLKLAFGISIIMVVSAEMLGGQTGLGGRLQASGQILETGEVFAILMLLAILGGALTKGQEKLDRLLGRWRT